MPAHRIPRAKAAVAGLDVKNPQRYRQREDPKAGPLGRPPEWMNSWQRATWATFASEIPWLNASHRTLLEIAVTIRAEFLAGNTPSMAALNLLRQCLGQMGATPADATKVSVPDGADQDPDEAFFGRPN